MTFTELVSEVYERGFHYLNDSGTQTARVGRWVNEALNEIYEAAEWPFLETTTTGNAPLALTRARQILSVVNTTDSVELDFAPREFIMDIYGTPPAGTPKYWYVEYLATDTFTLIVAPTAADSLSVRFIQNQSDISGSTSPILPARFHWLAVEGAVRRAYVDSDQYEQAAAVETFRQQGLELMKSTMLRTQHASPNLAMVTAKPMVNPATGEQKLRGEA